jgi:hypothetical protein
MFNFHSANTTEQSLNYLRDFPFFDISNNIISIQSYNPLYSVLFDVDKYNVSKICFNQKYNIYNEFRIQDNLGNIIYANIFVKHSPLLDPIHYLIGKYQKQSEQIDRLPQLENVNDCHPKVNHYNNASYIDNFFNYLSSKLLHKHGIIHGIDYYGSHLAIQKQFRFNVFDDMDYLEESEYFLKTNNVKYFIENVNTPLYLQNKNTKSKRPVVHIEDDVKLDDIIDEYDDIEEQHDQHEQIDSSSEIVFNMESDGMSDSDDSNISNSSDEEDNTLDGEDDSDDNEDDDNDSDDNEDDDNDNESDDSNEDEELFAYLYDFPVQMIALEKCDGTFDSLLENEKLSEKEIIAALMQVIMTLIVYQKGFSFTHNDLHTNNILYVTTSQKHISYLLNGKHYKVPTYGKIYKIIDFGRSIYRYQDKTFCSDSFAPGGDANGQYNCEPYFNQNKKRLEPNFSFDLCRLSCSLYDFVFEEELFIKESDMNEVQKLISKWCTDDYGKNILYKRNGDERYPQFKLYKMIARTVHSQVPEEQLSLQVFSHFISKHKRPAKYIDIDNLPIYWE